MSSNKENDDQSLLTKSSTKILEAYEDEGDSEEVEEEHEEESNTKQAPNPREPVVIFDATASLDPKQTKNQCALGQMIPTTIIPLPPSKQPSLSLQRKGR